MSNNVKTSTSEAAANCVALPQDYLTKNLVILPVLPTVDGFRRHDSRRLFGRDQGRYAAA